jgi:hypothetical protein
MSVYIMGSNESTTRFEAWQNEIYNFNYGKNACRAIVRTDKCYFAGDIQWYNEHNEMVCAAVTTDKHPIKSEQVKQLIRDMIHVGAKHGYMYSAFSSISYSDAKDNVPYKLSMDDIKAALKWHEGQNFEHTLENIDNIQARIESGMFINVRGNCITSMLKDSNCNIDDEVNLKRFHNKYNTSLLNCLWTRHWINTYI